VKRYLLPLGMFLAAIIALGLPAGAQETPGAQQVVQASPAPSPTPTPKPFQMGGSLDIGWQNASASNPNNIIGGRVFDTVSGNPQLHALNLQASYTGPIGGKIELTIGDDGEYLHSYPQILNAFGAPPYPASAPSLFTYGPGISSKVDVTQAYLSGTAGPLTLIGGKFATLAGAEVLEGAGNTNYSRSILFGFAIPFTHTGFRLTWAAMPTLNVIAGINRGWDVTRPLGSPANGALVGDNSSLTFEYGLAWNPVKAFGLTAQGYSGRIENWNFAFCATTACNRSLIDVVATYHFSDALTLIVNADSATQTNTFSPATPFGGSVKWGGVAGYLNWVVNPQWSASGRYEIFGDPHGYRTGFGGTRWTEGTLTVSYLASPNLTLRVEGRADKTNQTFFFPNRAAGQATNASIGLQAIVHAP
jgi:hypothetical protein